MKTGKRKSRAGTLVFIAFFGVFSVGLTAFLSILLWPKGDKVGVIDLRAPASAVSVPLADGDKMFFRLDVTLGMGLYPNASRERKSAIYDDLRTSMITITATSAGGAAATTRCSAYDGTASSWSGGPTEVEIGGAPLACTFAGLPAGPTTFRAEVAWSPRAGIRAAVLEVRRQGR